jgi:hypothetical protein
LQWSKPHGQIDKVSVCPLLTLTGETMEIETRVCMYDTAELLDNDIRLLAPVNPLHPLWDDVRDDWLRDWQVE